MVGTMDNGKDWIFFHQGAGLRQMTTAISANVSAALAVHDDIKGHQLKCQTGE